MTSSSANESAFMDVESAQIARKGTHRATRETAIFSGLSSLSLYQPIVDVECISLCIYFSFLFIKGRSARIIYAH